MNYSIEILDDPYVMLVQVKETVTRDDFEQHIQEVREIFATLTEPLYLILDIRNVRLGFDDVMLFLQMGFRNEETITNHPMNRGHLVITDNRFYRTVMFGLQRSSFGAVKLRAFDSLEAALEWAQEHST